MNQIYIPDLFEFYNPYGNLPGQTTSNVTFNGTPLAGGGTNDATYSVVANENLNTSLTNIWNEFNVAYVRDAASEAVITTNTTAIGIIINALGALKTSSSQYNGTVKAGGTPPNPSYSMTTNEALNNVLVGIWNEFTATYTAIAAFSPGIALSVLNSYIAAFVTDFVISGLGNTSNTGLVATFGSGQAYIGGVLTTYAGGTETLTANVDNYLYIKNDGTITLKSVAHGNLAPSVDAGTQVIWELATNGSAVTSATDLRVFTPFTAAQISGLYAASTIGLSALKTEVTNLLLPTTSTTGKTLASNGSAYVEVPDLSIATATHRLGINQSAPLATLHLGGSMILSDDSTTNAGTIRYSGGKYYGRNGSNDLLIPQVLQDVSNITITSAQTNDTLYNNGSIWVNKPVGYTSVTVTNLALYIVLATDRKIIADLSTGTVNTQLPDATLNAGNEYFLSHRGSPATHNWTISSVAGNVLGASTLVISASGITGVHLFSDGVDWLGITSNH